MSEPTPSGAPPAAPTGAGSPERARGFGLGVAMAMIVGSIIGVGVFNLPTSLAFYGPISLVSMGLTTVGALALALLFASLSRRVPADGGPYAYARTAFGNGLGFANAWSYWITAWAGNAAIAVGWVLYVEVFINTGHDTLGSIILVLIGLWIPAAINLSRIWSIDALNPGLAATRQYLLMKVTTSSAAARSNRWSTARYARSAEGGSAVAAAGTDCARTAGTQRAPQSDEATTAVTRSARITAEASPEGR